MNSKLLIFLLLLLPVRMEAQVKKPDNKATDVKSLEEVTLCKDTDFQFRLEGNNYFEISKVYVCPKSLPVDVTVVDATPPNAPIPYATAWTINGNPDSSTNHTILLDSADFDVSGLALLTCSFTDSAGLFRELELKVKKNMKLQWFEQAGSYAFDENKEPNYLPAQGDSPGELGIPWNFIETNQSETMQTKAKPKKGHYAVNNITATNPDLVFNPAMLSTSPENVILTYNSGVPDSTIKVYGCSNPVPELKIFADSAKTFAIEFFRLCETDDDAQLVMPGDTVASPNDAIIAPGPDGSLDRWQKYSIWLQGDDTLWLNPSNQKYYVIAGPNLIAETPILPHDTTCAQNFTITLSMDTLNDIYNKIAVNAVSISVTDLYVNFDIRYDDNMLELQEQTQLHKLRTGSDTLAADTTEVYLVNDLGKSNGNPILGHATDFGINTLALDVQDAQPSTLAHEVGHGKYALRHPEDQFGAPAPPNNYKTNFMHETSTGRINVVRRYQFGLIHKIK
jgi:hypothetical protein